MNGDARLVNVPRLQEILEFLPMNPTDEVDVVKYILNTMNLITINYYYEQYQISYFGVHLLYMTFIYNTIWKISRICQERYRDAVVFARPYTGREADLKLDSVNSIFDYSLIPEKDISKIFKIIGLDQTHIKSVCGCVDLRNEMAHANGKLSIILENDFSRNVEVIFNSMNNIQQCMNNQLRMWYIGLIDDYHQNLHIDYPEPIEFIEEQMISGMKLSIKDLQFIRDIGVNRKDIKPMIRKDLTMFKSTLQSHLGSILDHDHPVGITD